MDFFHHNLASQLSGFFHGRFWKDILPQVCHDEPVIFHAVCALSTMWEDGIVGTGSSWAGTEVVNDFALKSYNRAIRLLMGHLDDPRSIKVPLMACLVFVCVDCLRQDAPVALMHIDSGVKLLASWKQNCLAPGVPNSISQTPEFNFIEETLVPMFSWLNMLSNLYGRTSHSISSFSANSDRLDINMITFEIFEEVRISLLGIFNASVKFFHEVGESKYQGQPSDEVLMQRDSLSRMLDRWKFIYDCLVHKSQSTLDQSTKNGLGLYTANCLAVSVWLKACLHPQETIWDRYQHQYEEIITLSEIALNDTSRFPDINSRFFSFECSILPPLQFVAWRCRWPTIRRKALALLRIAPQMVLFFNSAYTCALYERVMILEESGLGLQPNELPRPDQLPLESSRIHQIDMPPLPPTPSGRPVNFLSKPMGPDGSWHIHSEYLNVNDIRPLKWSDILNLKKKKKIPSLPPGANIVGAISSKSDILFQED